MKKYIKKIVFLELKLQCHFSKKYDNKIIRMVELCIGDIEHKVVNSKIADVDTNEMLFSISDMNDLENGVIEIIIEIIKNLECETITMWQIGVTRYKFKSFYRLVMPSKSLNVDESLSIIKCYFETKNQIIEKYEKINKIHKEDINDIKQSIIEYYSITRSMQTKKLFINIKLYEGTATVELIPSLSENS